MMTATYPSLEGRRAIVTGGASGIGEALVRALVSQRARVAFIDCAAEGGTRLCEELRACAAHAPLFRALDLTDLDALELEVPRLIEDLGGCDVLVNNAANDTRHTLDDITPAYWRDRMAVNLDHFVFMTKAALPAMAAEGGGSVINMGSCSWRLGLGGMVAYVTAKAAIEGLTNGLARDLGPSRIRVNCVIPGFIKTARQVEKWLTPELERTVFAGQCLPGFVEPTDVADLVLFLASDNARMCTSGTYTVDGGWI
jgi:NAD(P)-dependent dehydrogenase (short-subunit alcohol dehydrogenase family)